MTVDPADVRVEDAVQIPLRALRPHPKNARRGDVDAIADSLLHHGQYAPIVVNQDNVILAGHHVVKAARRLKWKTVDAVRVNVTEEEALVILMADNRDADLASQDPTRLLSLLESLSDLAGTGYGPADLAALDALIAGDTPSSPPEPAGEEDDHAGSGKSTMESPKYVEIRIGPRWRWEMSLREFNSWAENVLGDASRSKAVSTLKHLLDLPHPPRPESPAERDRFVDDITTANPKDLIAHPDNAREGDIGAIVQTLLKVGQYRPVTANIQTGHVVKGNHTLAAIRRLGWKSIAVRWINVSPEEEKRIMLIDNRVSELGSYNTKTVVENLTEIGDLDGTGYTGDDLDDLVAGGTGVVGPPATGMTAVKIGRYAWKIQTDLFDQWAEDLDGSTIRRRLRLPESAA